MKNYILSPFDASLGIDEYRTLLDYCSQANPWVKEKVLVNSNGMVIWERYDFYTDSKETIETEESVSISNKYELMNDDEKILYDSLPQIFKAYRGFALHPDIELDRTLLSKANSWTLDKNKAEFFTKYHSQHKDDSVGFITTALINKADVFAVLLEREEQEVLMFDDKFILEIISIDQTT